MICPGCQSWMTPIAEPDAGRLRCSACGAAIVHRFRPLCILTGPSGAGKTALLGPLARLLPEWDCFETDILWDSGGDWTMAHQNWLRIAASLHAQGRPVLLSGTILPASFDGCATLPLFSQIHWLALAASPETIAARLRARPAWRGCDEAFVAGQLDLLRHVDATMPTLSTEDATIDETAAAVRDWARACWSRDPAVGQ